MRKVSLGILGVVGFAALFTVACGQTDMGITTKVKSRLDTDRTLNSSQIQVSTRNKVVTLSGLWIAPDRRRRRLESPAAVKAWPTSWTTCRFRRRSRRCRSSAAGTNAAPDDAPSPRRSSATFRRSRKRRSEPVNVQTEGGVVTLSGTVKTPAEKDQVIQIARGTEGVQRVEDKIQVATS